MNDDGHVVCDSWGVEVLMNGYGKAKIDVPIKHSNSFELVFNCLQCGNSFCRSHSSMRSVGRPCMEQCQQPGLGRGSSTITTSGEVKHVSFSTMWED